MGTRLLGLIERLPWQGGDVAVMDRGFPSRKRFAVLVSKGIDLIAGMSTSEAVAGAELWPFLEGKKKVATVDLQLRGSDGPVTVRVRLNERDSKRGRLRQGAMRVRMVILTTLDEADGFDRQSLIKRYGARWGIESLFGEMKSFMQVEDFHSGVVQGCEQEIVAAMIWMALGSSM